MFDKLGLVELRDECRRSGAPEAFVSESGRDDLEKLLTRLSLLEAFGVRPNVVGETLRVLQERARAQEVRAEAEAEGAPESVAEIAEVCERWLMPEWVLSAGAPAVRLYASKCHVLALAGMLPSFPGFDAQHLAELVVREAGDLRESDSVADFFGVLGVRPDSAGARAAIADLRPGQPARRWLSNGAAGLLGLGSSTLAIGVSPGELRDVGGNAPAAGRDRELRDV